ncbi:cysteine proteinase [Cystobasidium minutum MCA 4210]|uniref:cysteine proteinase n=1 Tax=Cystobasidium minutum MCA 4210 TaxID=1397322 RepID=UPI0034CE00E8|eukprot:jgi/Rhomi1/162690/estExt_Genewise1Plus.C_6_t10294
MMQQQQEPPISVEDGELFAQKYMPDLGQDIDDFRVFTWRIKNYREQDKRICSPEFECGNHKWSILLFPQGNSNGQANDMVSVYLNYGDSKHAPENWHVCAQFALSISNPEDPTHFIQSQAHHRFTPEEQDWGFTRFVDLKKLFQPDPARGRPIIENDETVVTAFVRVLKDPTGVLWHNWHNYDSKKETGYVGLKNQGATCYMNSLLQSLFFTNAYRKAVYQIPTENDSPDSVPLALQRVFYLLQTSELPVSTTDLTRSFGWTSLDSFLQHDVQEFNRVLQDKLEMKMKGTKADGAIKELFSGKMKSYIKCINVEYESSRSEEFYDIQLNVKGMKNLEAAFKDYVAEETLEGENRYQAEGYGLQDAKKGVIFQSFPPVLHLQLKRFEYDFMRDVNVKINDRYEFPLEIDLKPYLDPETTPADEDWNYKLHGVLVHSGDVHGGHYFVLIKPTPDGKWFKLDDDRVIPVLEKEVLEDNFGGEGKFNGVNQPVNKQQAKIANKRINNAYMLVYIREKRLQEVLQPIGEADTPPHLRYRLEKEKKDAEAKRREREEQHLYLTAKVITDETFKKHQGFDLANFDERNAAIPVAPVTSYRVPKNQPYVEFKAQICQENNLNPEEVRLWVLVNRQNKTVRPDAVVPEDDPTLTMESVRDKMASRQQDLKLYLEIFPIEEKIKWAHDHPEEPPIMIFVKHFDVSAQTLAGVGHFYVHKNMRVQDLVPMICEKTAVPLGTPLKIYEEIKPNMIELMKTKATFLQSEIQDGDILCFQAEPSEADARDLEKQHQYTNPIQFYDFFMNRIVVAFKPRFEDQEYKSEFELTLSKKMTYDQVATQVGDHLKYPWNKIRFTASNGNNGVSKNPIRRHNSHTLAEMIQPGYVQQPTNVLFYETLEVTLTELETKKTVKVTWVGLHNKEEGIHTFLMAKTASLYDVVDNLHRNIKFAKEGGTGRIRLFEIPAGGRTQKIFNGNELIKDMTGQVLEDLYAEEIPQEEADVKEGERIIMCYHFTKDPTRTHGVPFRFVLRPGEAFADTKKRVQQRLGYGDKEFSKIKFALIMPSTYQKPSPINDEDDLSKHEWAKDDYLGLDHPDRSGKNRLEKALYIR